MESNNVKGPLYELMLSGRSRKFKKGQVVNSSDINLALTLIKSGFIMRYIISNSGSTSIQSIYGQDNFYPLTLTFRILFNQEIYSGPETVYYEAMTDSELYFVDSEVFVQEVKKSPLLYRDILKEAGKRFYSNIQSLENISLPNSTKRVAHQLLYYSKEFGKEKNDSSIEIYMPITHSLLASVLDLTRETVSQSMKELRDLGLITNEARSVRVTDVDKLHTFAYS